MKRKLPRTIFAMALLTVMLIQTPLSFACGPFSLESIFVFTVHPEYPLEDFARGQIGVVPPSYARSYLYVAYRYLSGASFNATEQQAVVDLWRDRLDLRWTPDAENAVQGWLDARKKVAGLSGEGPKIDVYRSREKPHEYANYLNCQQDAFENAATTLAARIQKFGADSAAVKEWVEAQDQVFANCSEGQHIPAALPADVDALRRADRQYQIAAANFYAGNFVEATALFESIAADANSPWRSTAPYLAARTSIRKASLGPEETTPAALKDSEERLTKILGDPELKASHASATRLLGLVRLRLHPEERMHELALSLASKTEQPNLKQDLWDYTVLLDGFTDDESTHHRNTSASARPSEGPEDDLTDWIVTFQSEKPDAVDHSLTRWQETSSVPWLIAALSKVGPQHPKAAALQQAATSLPPTSPAYATASFHSIRLDVAAGRSAEARTKLDDLLHQQPSRFNRSALNLLQEQRVLVSQSLEDFLTYAQRIPGGLSWNDDGREVPVDEAEASDELKKLQGKTLFDTDAGEILNHKMPLSVLSQIPTGDSLPEHLRRDVTQAVWLRAVLLGDAATATALVPKLKALVPEMTPLLNNYATARDPAAKKFAALYAWLKFPGLEPVVDTGIGREQPLNEQESYRDNWWCTAAFSSPGSQTVPEEKKAGPAGVPEDKRVPVFLTAAQRAAAAKEDATLNAFGAAPNYLCRQVVEWATKNPGDPRVPEALHLAVKTTRYGCTDKQTGRWSKAAYDFLHRRYPNNQWTKQTPYWFKD
jgi:hypothetical protein